MAEETSSRKRSRFDQAPTESKRRSRSPPSERDERGRRDRSPLRSGNSSSPKPDAATAAKDAAAKINAEIMAKRSGQHVDVPAVRRSASAQSPTNDSSTAEGEPVSKDGVYQKDGDWKKEIEINDLRNRYMLTKGDFHKKIREDTGADITMRGSYYPDKKMATAANPPLHLVVTSISKEGLQKAVARIEEKMEEELPNLVDERRFGRRPQQEQVNRDEHGRRKWPEERIPVDLELVPGFNLRAQVVGHQGAYVKHIQSETGCRVQIKGRGSGFLEQSTGHESDEPMYLHVAGPDASRVQRAKELCEDLLGNVKEQYRAFKERGGQRQRSDGDGGRDGHGDHHRGGSYGGGGSNSYGGYHQGGNYGGQQSPTVPASQEASTNPPPPPGTADPHGYGAAYSQYYAGQQAQEGDPYAEWGGYDGYIKAYYQWYAQYYGQAGQDPAQYQYQYQYQAQPEIPGAPGTSYQTPPPPPPSEAPPGVDQPPPPPPPPPPPGTT